MKLKTIALAMLLATGGAAQAAPTLQSCSPMEVTHNGAAGLSYSLSCSAGDWALKYTGSVPAGTDSVLARYRVVVSNPDGSSFTQSRSVRVPSPAMLGQALVREAVALDNGDLALRDCAEFSCTLYRPLANSDKLAKAAITVAPEVKRLTDETIRLTAELSKRQADLSAQAAKSADLEHQVKILTARLDGAEKSLTDAKSALESTKQQYGADISGLMSSSQKELERAKDAADAQARSRLDEMTKQLAAANNALATARKDLADCQAAHAMADAAKTRTDAQVDALSAKSAELQTALSVANGRLTAAQGNLAKQTAAAERAQQATGQSAETAALRLKLDSAGNQVKGLSARVSELEGALATAQAQLTEARAMQSEHKAALADAGESQDKQSAVLEMSLANAQITIAEMTSARVSQVNALLDELGVANKKVQDAEQALKSAREAHAAEVSALKAKLAQQAVVPPATDEVGAAESQKLVADRDAALAKLAAMQVQYEKMDAQRLDALRGAQTVAKQMLEALDQFQILQQQKDEADKALDSTTNKLMEMSTKLQAANLARDLSMQTVTAANADADTQNIKNQELAKRLAASDAQLAVVRAERDRLTTAAQAHDQRTAELENRNVEQAAEIEQLRRQLAEKGGELQSATSSTDTLDKFQ